MSRPAAKGWCPGALRPMVSGDGLIVRVRPRLGRLRAAEVQSLCAAAERFGSGVVEVTSRANIQIRGVREHGALVGELRALGLLDRDAEAEGRRNMLVTPLWREGDLTARLAEALEGRLGELPALPGKFGFAVDAGPVRLLADASADVRIERGRGGGLIVRADGAGLGARVAEAEAVEAALALARWFTESGGIERGRMARHLAAAGAPAGDEPPAEAGDLRPGKAALGPVVAVPFGQVEAAALARLVRQSGARAVRLAPGRLLLLEGGSPVAADGFITEAGDPLLDVDACPGAPACAAATVETRELARSLAGRVEGRLHVSGCAKGCARARAADVTLVGREGRFDLVLRGQAWEKPAETGLRAEEVRARFWGAGC